MRNVEGAKAGSNQKKPYRAPVSVTSTQRMRIKYGISEGTIRGFSAEFSHNEMLKRIYLDGTPIMSAEGEQLLDVVVEFRDGSRDQEPINGLPSISVEHDVGVEVKKAAPVSRSFDRSDTTSYDVRISVPTLYQGNDEGDSWKGLIQFKIDVSTDGGAFEEAGRFEIYEKILNGFAETYNVVVPKGSNHVVRISRLNSEVVSDYSVNRLVVEAISENTDVRLRYANTAVLYLEYDAEQFSNVPKLEMRVFGKNDILVPANYNGDTHTYATSGAGTTNGVWDGTWKRAYTDNPVWIALDLMISRRYGLGDKIDLTFINKWELYGLAQYCDEAVADGKGGFEPRFTCNNMYLQKSEDAYRVLKDLAASFRAKVVWDGEFITLQADVPRDPVHTFSNANASDITYSSTQDSAQRNLINVQYYDRDNKFASDVVMQRSNSNILSRGKVVDGNFTALGCASQGQAQRIASYVMNTELYETELVSFTTGLEGGLVRLNDVIQMADNSVAGQTVGGRIAAVNGRSITLDRKIPDNVQAIATTQLSINRQDVKNEPISIVSISDDRMTAVLASDAPAGTEAGLVWALLTQDLVPQKFVVTDIEFDSTNMTFAVSAIQYNESKYAAIDGSARIVVPPISVTEYKMLKAPIIVIASYLTRIIQDAVVCDIDVSWAQSTNAVQYQLEMQKAGSDWRIVGRFMSLATTLDNMYTGTYTFRVCAYDSLGNASQYTYSDPILVAGKVLPPPMLAQYNVIGILFGYQHKWIYPAHTEDSRAVRLRFTTTDPVASPVQEWQYVDVAYPTANFTEQDVTAHLRTWFSAAIVDKYGNVGAYTAWLSVVPSSNPAQVLDLLDGQLTAQQLDRDLTTKIAIGAEAALAASSAQNAADAAAQAATDAQAAANNAATAASNAQTTANTAKSTSEQAKADIAALTTSTNTTATELRGRLTTAENGLTQEKLDRASGDNAVVGQLNTYKSANNAALAAVQQKAEAASNASASNAQALSSLTATVNTKNRTFRQATAPTTNRVVGDLWVNTAAGKNNEVRRWNGTAWDDLTDPRTGANATALTNLQTTVTAINGRTTANTNSITQLSTDLTTLSNNVDAKADASAVDSLTALVSTAEGNITSQGTRVTNLENTVDHATTGLASKASSSALTAVDNKVTATNGRIDTTNSNVTTLTGRVSTVEGAVSTKAEASALTALTTRVTNAEGVNTSQGSAITTLQNTVNHATTGLASKASSAALTTLDNKVTAIDGRVTSNSSSITSLNNSLTTTNTNVTEAQTAATNAMTAAGQKGKVIFGTTVPVAADQLSQNLWIDTTGNANTPKRWNGTAWVVVTDKVATDALAAANAASSLAAIKADSSALTALDSKVTTIDGKVTAQATDILNLSTGLTNLNNSKLDAFIIQQYRTAVDQDSATAGAITQFSSTLGTTENLFLNSAFNDFSAYDGRNHWFNNTAAETLSVESWGSLGNVLVVTPIPTGSAQYKGVATLVDGGDYTFNNKLLQLRVLTSSSESRELAVIIHVMDGQGDLITQHYGALPHTAGYTNAHTLSFPAVAGVRFVRVIFHEYNAASAVPWAILEPSLATGTTPIKQWSPNPKDGVNIGVSNATAIAQTNSRVGNVENGIAAQATQLTHLSAKLNERKVYRLYSGGLEAATGGAGYIQGFDPFSEYYIGRSYGLIVFNGDGSIQTVNTYDVFGGQTQGFIEAVAAIPFGTYAAVLTSDEPQTNNEYIRDALKSLGGTDAVSQVVYRGAYLLVGRRGLPTGQAIEKVSNTKLFGVDYILEMYNGIPIGLGGSSPQSDIVSNMRTEVSNIGGNITALAVETNTLSTTVGNNTASIQLQQSSINGLEAKATLQVEAGGTIGGVALGNNGGVVDVLIRSNTFAIAPPVSAGAGDAGKYMFQYRATPVTLPNGHVSPAGAYIGRASIDYVDATQIYVESLSAISAELGTIKVGSANIADLAVTAAKIGDAQITTAKIGDLQVDTLKIKDNAVTVGIASQNTTNLTIVTGGGQVRVNVGITYYRKNGDSRFTDTLILYRDGIELKRWSFSGYWNSVDYAWEVRLNQELPMVVDIVGAGTHTYSLSGLGTTSMALLEVKK